MLEANKVYCMDAFEFLKQLDDNSVDLIVIDPPYNIGKDEWDKIKKYIDWMELIFFECQRVLKNNGSFYFFHNEFPLMAELQNIISKKTKFIFRSLLVWNKRFDGVGNKGFLDGFIEVEKLRNYQKMAEYILYYTFQDDTGLKQIYEDIENFKEIRDYMNQEKKKAGLKTCKQINQILEVDDNGGGMASHFFSKVAKQWTLPTKDKYLKLQSTGFFKKPYEELLRRFKEYRKEYESLRKKFEEERYTFNNQKKHHSIWNYKIIKKEGHITPKPLDLIKNIILHSSNKGDLVLDCFMGSGTTAIACKELGRNFIGCDDKQEYVNITNRRLEQNSLLNIEGGRHSSHV